MLAVEISRVLGPKLSLSIVLFVCVASARTNQQYLKPDEETSVRPRPLGETSEVAARRRTDTGIRENR